VGLVGRFLGLRGGCDMVSGWVFWFGYCGSLVEVVFLFRVWMGVLCVLVWVCAACCVLF